MVHPFFALSCLEEALFAQLPAQQGCVLLTESFVLTQNEGEAS